MSDMHHNSPTEGSRQNGFFKSRAGIALWVFLAIAAFYLLAEHRAHLAGILPWLLLAVCPLLHVFMHKGHGSHGGHGDHRGEA